MTWINIEKCAQWNKPGIQGHILYDRVLHRAPRARRLTEQEAEWKLREGEGRYFLVCTEFISEVVTKSGEQEWWWLHNIVNAFDGIESHMSKW